MYCVIATEKPQWLKLGDVNLVNLFNFVNLVSNLFRGGFKSHWQGSLIPLSQCVSKCVQTSLPPCDARAHRTAVTLALETPRSLAAGTHQLPGARAKPQIEMASEARQRWSRVPCIGMRQLVVDQCTKPLENTVGWRDTMKQNSGVAGVLKS